MTVPLADNIKAAAKVYLGTIEIQPNVGFTGKAHIAFTNLLKRAGWVPISDEPYCALTATQLITEAFAAVGKPLPPQLIRTASTSAAALHAKSVGKLSKYPATGCLALMKGGETGWHHTAICWEVHDDGTMTTFEANTTNPDDPSQQGVFLKQRNVADFDYVVW